MEETGEMNSPHPAQSSLLVLQPWGTLGSSHGQGWV